MTVKDGNVDGLTGGVIVGNRKTAIIDFAFYRCNLVVRKSFAFSIDPVDRHTKHPLSCHDYTTEEKGEQQRSVRT